MDSDFNYIYIYIIWYTQSYRKRSSLKKKKKRLLTMFLILWPSHPGINTMIRGLPLP